jgi:hypothetical protein
VESPASTKLDKNAHQDGVGVLGDIARRVALAVMNVRLDLAAHAVGAVYLPSFFPLTVVFPTSETYQLIGHLPFQTSLLSHTSSFSTPTAPVSSIRPLALYPLSCVCDLDSPTCLSSSIDCPYTIKSVVLASASARRKRGPGHELRCRSPARYTCIQLHKRQWALHISFWERRH